MKYLLTLTFGEYMETVTVDADTVKAQKDGWLVFKRGKETLKMDLQHVVSYATENIELKPYIKKTTKKSDGSVIPLKVVRKESDK